VIRKGKDRREYLRKRYQEHKEEINEKRRQKRRDQIAYSRQVIDEILGRSQKEE